MTKVTKSYTSGALVRKVISGIDLSIAANETVAVVGVSGIGKSTLLRILGGLDHDYAGDVSLFHGSTRLTPGEARHRRLVGFVFQRPTLFHWLSVLDNVLLPYSLGVGSYGRLEASDEAIRLLADVGLSGYESARPRELSIGMQSRVAVVRALVQRPKLLLLDEPGASLDEVTRIDLDRAIAKLLVTSSATTVLVTHTIEEAADLASRIVVLQGRPVTTLREFLVPPGVRTDRVAKVELIERIRADISIAVSGSKGVTP